MPKGTLKEEKTQEKKNTALKTSSRLKEEGQEYAIRDVRVVVVLT